MPDNVPQLRVDGLTSLQLAELKAAVATTGGNHVATLDNPSLGGGTVGEPTLLTAVITIGPSVISAVALWLAKQRKGRTRNFRYTRISSDGATESFEMDESSYNEGGSSLKAIQTLLEGKFGHDTPA